MKYVILILIIAVAAVYIRGSMKILESSKFNCKWNVIYAICEGPQVKAPSFIDAFKEGMKY